MFELPALISDLLHQLPGNAPEGTAIPPLAHPSPGNPDLSTTSGLRSLARALVHGSYGVGPKEIVAILIETDGPVDARSLVEVSVHLPRRGTRWVAAFRDANGRQVWRTTGLRERQPALVLARRWEAQAKRQRAAQPAAPPKLTIRVRPGSTCLSQKEVAAILRISDRAVRQTEKTAIEKLRRNPLLRDIWRELGTGEIKEAASRGSSPWALSRAEIAAVYALAKTPAERQALRKLLALTQGGS